MRKTFLLFILVTFSIPVFSQYSVSGKVIDKKTSTPLDLVTVKLSNANDSSFYKGTRTDSLGNFTITDVANGTYLLDLSSIGYSDYSDRITIFGNKVILNNISMTEDAKVLKEVNVTAAKVEVIVKGDTIEYNADAFKTDKNAVTEDLLKKMPGVEIGSDGSITVNGQKITKILVDGKKFFDGDLQMSTKNIPAEIIDKVQVMDRKSDMAQLTGFEDDDTERVINLTIKKDRKQGVFGNVKAGAGADADTKFRYDANGFLNVMDGDTRHTLTFGANNVNNSRSGRGRRGFGGPRSGITETQNLGYNLNTIVNPKLELGGDATFNHSDNLVTSDTHRENYFSQDSTYITDTKDFTNINNYQGNVRLEAEWKPDELNTIVIQPNIGYTSSKTDSYSDFLYKSNNDSTSWGDTENHNTYTSVSAGLNIMYSHKFAKPGRTLTTRLSTSVSQNTTDGFYFNKLTTAEIQDSVVNQRLANSGIQNNFGINVSYVEPLWAAKHLLEIAVSANTSYSTSDRNIYEKGDNSSNEYTLLNTEYSNSFNNTFYNEAAAVNYRYNDTKYKILLGVKLQPSQMKSNTIYSDSTLSFNNKVINFSPTARLQFNFDKRKFLRMDYNGTTNQPSISQMQPVKDNTNLMRQTVGNPDLKPEFQHNLRFMYSNFNSNSMASLNLGLMGNFTQNDLENNSIYDKNGKSYSQTVNGSEMPYSLNLFTMFYVPVFKYFNISNNASARTSKQYGYTARNVSESDINTDNLVLGSLSATSSSNLSENLSIGYSQDAVEFTVRGGLRYSYTTNNLTSNETNTYDWTGQANLVLRPFTSTTFSTDMGYTKQTGYSSYNDSQWLWNASLDFTVLHNLGIISLAAKDILRQQKNISQSAGDNYVIFSKSNALPSYYMLSFTYKINYFKGKSNPAENEMGQGRRWRDRDGGRPEPPKDNNNRTPSGPPPEGDGAPGMEL